MADRVVMLRHLDGFTLPASHPLASREAYQCDDCDAITYPSDPSLGCPLCNENDYEEAE